MKLSVVRQLKTYQLYAIFAGLMVLVVLFIPPNHATVDRYQLSTAAYRVLLLATVAVPSFLTWAAAFYGYEQLHNYSSIIRKTHEGDAFGHITRGSRWVALYLPIVTLIALIFMGLANAEPRWHTAAVWITTYVAIAISITAFINVSTGARILSNSANVRPTLLKTRLLTFGFICMGVLYCYLIIRHGMTSHGIARHVPIAWTLLTVVVPYFFAWFMGLLAVLDIDAYASNVAGVLYRRALRELSAGLLAIIMSSILLQYVNSASTERGRLVLGSVLVFRYILFVGLAIGFGLVGNSAKKLQQMEKI